MEFVALFFGGLILYIVLMWLFDLLFDKGHEYSRGRDNDYLNPNIKPSIEMKNVPKAWRPKKK